MRSCQTLIGKSNVLNWPRGLLIALTLLANQDAVAITAEESQILRETVKDLCVTPDRSGEYLKAQGEAKAGLPVPIKLVKADVAGTISYESFKGIPIVLDTYKTDPRTCAIELTKLLLPTFKPAEPMETPQSPKQKFLKLAATKDLEIQQRARAVRFTTSNTPQCAQTSAKFNDAASPQYSLEETAKRGISDSATESSLILPRERMMDTARSTLSLLNTVIAEGARNGCIAP